MNKKEKLLKQQIVNFIVEVIEKGAFVRDNNYSHLLILDDELKKAKRKFYNGK